MTPPRPSKRSDTLPRRGFIARALALVAGGALTARPGRARAEAQFSAPEFLAEIRLFAGNFAPDGWAFCNGQILSIAPNTALFSLLGTTYGGNGTTTFALPDLRGRIPIHAGASAGPGLSPRSPGERAGAENHTLTLAELPAHAHAARASTFTATLPGPAPAGVPAMNPAGIPMWGDTPALPMSIAALGNAGSGQSHTNLQPFLALNYIIGLEGQYPTT
jgi:microcystin-dependent protein